MLKPKAYAKLNLTKKSYVGNARLEKARSAARKMPAFKALPEHELLFTDYTESTPLVRTGGDRVSFGLGSDGTVQMVPQVPNTISVKLARAKAPAGKPKPATRPTKPKAAAAPGKKLQVRTRPLTLGLSIGHAEDDVGTLGLFVRLAPERTEASGIGILSTATVLAPAGAEIGDPIYQPGRGDAKKPSESLLIGHLRDYTLATTAYPNHFDLGVAELTEPAARGVVGNVLGGDMIAAVHDKPNEWLSQRVLKIGRTTGLTHGVVTTVAIDGLEVSSGGKSYVYDDVFEIMPAAAGESFSAAGDSGSLIVLEATKQAIGILFAGGVTDRGPVTYAMRLGPALKNFGAQMLVPKPARRSRKP